VIRSIQLNRFTVELNGFRWVASLHGGIALCFKLTTATAGRESRQKLWQRKSSDPKILTSSADAMW
jgi:hypothetical protein